METNFILFAVEDDKVALEKRLSKNHIFVLSDLHIAVSIFFFSQVFGGNLNCEFSTLLIQEVKLDRFDFNQIAIRDFKIKITTLVVNL